MSTEVTEGATRSYGCTFGCGNPYDYIVVSCADGSTEFLCLPCYVRLATDMIAAVTDPDDPKVKAALAEATPFEQAPMTNKPSRKRGKHAPATVGDEDILEAFDSVITEDELPEAFK